MNYEQRTTSYEHHSDNNRWKNNDLRQAIFGNGNSHREYVNPQCVDNQVGCTPLCLPLWSLVAQRRPCVALCEVGPHFYLQFALFLITVRCSSRLQAKCYQRLANTSSHLSWSQRARKKTGLFIFPPIILFCN